MTPTPTCPSNPFFDAWNTPDGVPPFGRIEPEHFRQAYERALAEHEAEIAAIAANPAAAELRQYHRGSGTQRPGARPASATSSTCWPAPTATTRCLRSSATSRRRSPAIGTRFIPTRRCSAASIRWSSEADRLGLRCRAKARARALSHQLPPRRRRRSTPPPRSASPRSSSGSPRSAPRSARTCWPTSRPSRWRSMTRPNLPACPTSCARR